ncbi:hypothetical protein DH09_05470 [Bacillaceae bacterium JMAK1]|nr:hypothetical protein DH09_05470 [Bacillaceae bacterium JMAK1]
MVIGNIIAVLFVSSMIWLTQRHTLKRDNNKKLSLLFYSFLTTATILGLLIALDIEIPSFATASTNFVKRLRGL